MVKASEKMKIMMNCFKEENNMATIIRRARRFWFGLAVVGLSAAVALVGLIAIIQPAGAAPADPLVGYGAGTTGGAGGSTVTVSTLSALTSAVSGSTAKTVKISGTISGSGDVKVGSNKTILGIGSSSILNGLGLDLKGVTNVIIRNLTIRYVTASSGTGDNIHIENSTKIWVDHNDLYSDRTHGKDYYDGLLDITHAGDYITVSWNRLHDHYKVSLVGHSDSNGAQDTGHLHVTFAHNWFYNDGSRLPSLRFGTAHVYNNYFQNVTLDAVHSRENAQVLVQNNVFRNVATAITTTGDSKVDGYANASGNDYGGATVTITKTGSFTNPPYSFTLDATSSVISEVTAYSGVGIVG
jgi:pectate lyase